MPLGLIWYPCTSYADVYLQSDAMPDSRRQAGELRKELAQTAVIIKARAEVEAQWAADDKLTAARVPTAIALSPTLAAGARQAAMRREMSLDSASPSNASASVRREVSLDSASSQARPSTARGRPEERTVASHAHVTSWTEPVGIEFGGKAVGAAVVDSAHEHYDGPQEVVVRLDGSGQLGIQFVGPEIQGQVGTFVTKVMPGSVASKDGVIQPGMLIHAINRSDCLCKSKAEVMDMLSRSVDGGQTTVLLKVEMRQKDLVAQYGVGAIMSETYGVMSSARSGQKNEKFCT